MTRDGYLAFMLAFAVVLPIFVAAASARPASLARRMRSTFRTATTGSIRSAARRRLATLAAHARWLGSLIALFIAGVHYVDPVANASSPPRLPADLFWMLLVGFVAGLALWIGALYLRFRNVP